MRALAAVLPMHTAEPCSCRPCHHPAHVALHSREGGLRVRTPRQSALLVQAVPPARCSPFPRVHTAERCSCRPCPPHALARGEASELLAALAAAGAWAEAEQLLGGLRGAGQGAGNAGSSPALARGTWVWAKQ